MGLADKFKDLKTKAEDAVVERNEQIHKVVEKVTTTADERTGGKYREHIQKVGARADGLVDSVKRTEPEEPSSESPGSSSAPPEPSTEQAPSAEEAQSSPGQ
jgi:DNA-binding protein H-NS